MTAAAAAQITKLHFLSAFSAIVLIGLVSYTFCVTLV